MNDNVIAVVVTYNRKKLLIECLDAIYRQTYPVAKVILIDNASTDGTKEMLDEKGFLNKDTFYYLQMDKNLGGAGGFYEGMKQSEHFKADWVWIMDDDTIPYQDCLEKMLVASAKISGKISFLASSVEGINKEPMNVPELDLRPSDNGYSDWYRFLGNGIVKIKVATFVSLLINTEAIRLCGLPCKDYFIWGDDSEYTKRLTTYYAPAYLIGESKVCHKRSGAKPLSIKNEVNAARLEMYYYMYRNGLINTMFYETKLKVLMEIVYKLLFALSCLKYPKGIKRFSIIIKGTALALIEYKKYKNYISDQINMKIEQKKH